MVSCREMTIDVFSNMLLASQDSLGSLLRSQCKRCNLSTQDHGLSLFYGRGQQQDLSFEEVQDKLRKYFLASYTFQEEQKKKVRMSS